MNLATFAKKPKAFERLIGLPPHTFFSLAAELEPAWEKAEYRRKTRKRRVRAVGGGNQYKRSR